MRSSWPRSASPPARWPAPRAGSQPFPLPLACRLRLCRHAVMRCQRLVARLERFRFFAAWLHRRRQPIGAMALGHAAQFPQGVLHPFAETLQALRKTDRARLPVRIGLSGAVSK